MKTPDEVIKEYEDTYFKTPILTKPKHGWTIFTFNKFTCTPSYGTDVAVDLLDCAIAWMGHGGGVCFFDCEGDEYNFVLGPADVFVTYIDDNGNLQAKDLTVAGYWSPNFRCAFVKNLIACIEDNLQDWILWDAYSVAEEIKRRKLLQNKLDTLKRLFVLERDSDENITDWRNR